MRIFREDLPYAEDGLPFISIRQNPATALSQIESKILAKALNLPESDLLVNDLGPAVVKTEVTHLMVPIRNPKALNKAIPDKRLLIELQKNTISKEYIVLQFLIKSLLFCSGQVF